MPVLNIYHHGGKVPQGAVSIMRGTPFGNPYVIGRDGNRAQVVEMYRAWLLERLQDDDSFAAAVRGLDGKDLCCCCAPLQCHGYVLESVAKWLKNLTK